MISKSSFNKFKYQAKKRGKVVTLTFDEYLKIKISDCFYCEVEYYLYEKICKKLGFRTPYMTIDRKNNLEGYSRENSIACCFICNKTKGNFFTANEMKEIAQKYIKPKFESVKKEVWESYLEEQEYENP